MNADKHGIPDIQINVTGKGKNSFRSIGGYLDLPCWIGHFLDEATIYTKKDSFITDSRIGYSVDGGITPEGGMDISPEQVNAYWYLAAHQEHMKRSITEALVHDFPRLIEEDYQYYDIEEGGFPPLSEIVPGFDFKQYIGLTSIRIMEDVKDNMAYVTWYFNCRWDIEHGFQVITHKDRIIDIAQDADIYKMYKDNGTFEQVMAEYKDLSTPPPFAWKQKKWWQFWK